MELSYILERFFLKRTHSKRISELEKQNKTKKQKNTQEKLLIFLEMELCSHKTKNLHFRRKKFQP